LISRQLSVATTIFGGSYLNVGQEAGIHHQSILPASDQREPEFLFSFFRVLIEGTNSATARFKKNAVVDAIQRIYVLEPNQRTISNFGNILASERTPPRWTRRWTVVPTSTRRDTLCSKLSDVPIFTDGTMSPEVLEHCLFLCFHPGIE